MRVLQYEANPNKTLTSFLHNLIELCPSFAVTLDEDVLIMPLNRAGQMTFNRQNAIHMEDLLRIKVTVNEDRVDKVDVSVYGFRNDADALHWQTAFPSMVNESRGVGRDGEGYYLSLKNIGQLPVIIGQGFSHSRHPIYDGAQ